jgi:glycosyltransferase involved in cell wall biosynthesis
MPAAVSVIICTHNPRPASLHRVLDALQRQTLSPEHWELVMVDNASRTSLADAWDLSWHPRGLHVRENELGLTHARLCGIRTSSAPLLTFVDDDNVLAPEYLDNALTIAQRYPYLGVYGAGMLEPEFEIEPPSELCPFLGLLALRSVTRQRWSNHLKDFECFPWGAGLCARRQAATAFVNLVGELNVTNILGRQGAQLFCAEDDLFSWAAARLSFGFGIFPELRITHLIPKIRLSRSYFVRLVHAHSYSHAVLRFLLQGTLPEQGNIVSTARTLAHGARRGFFSMMCRRATLRGASDAAMFIDQHHLQPLSAMDAPATSLNRRAS